MADPIASANITGVVLAGGRGARMGGADKGLQDFCGVPLAQHALARLKPQAGALIVSANRNLPVYAQWGVPVCPDSASQAHAGPLAGVLAALDACRTPWLVTVPCDSPLFPHDLVSRLADGLARTGSLLAMALAPEQGALKPQPVFCLMHASLKGSLAQFLTGGGRKVATWAAQHAAVGVAFDKPGDDPRAFANANTLEELNALCGRT